MAVIIETQRGPSLGEPAPFFEATISNNKINLRDFEGNWVVILSHPDDILPVFKTRTINYILCKRKIKTIALGNGQSPDIISSNKNLLKKYIMKHSLTIVDDTDRSIGKIYGLDDKGHENAEGSKGLFVIDPKGILRIKLFSPLSTERNFYEIIKLVDALRDADKLRKHQPDMTGWKRRFGIVVKPKTVAEEG